MRVLCTVRLLMVVTGVLGALPAHANDDLRYIVAGDKTTQAVVVAGKPLAHTAQILPLDDEGRIVGKGKPAEQADKVLDLLTASLTGARTSHEYVVKLNVYAARLEVIAEVKKVLARRYPEARPAVSYVVGALAHPDALVAMDAVAVSLLDPGNTVQQVAGNKETSLAILPEGARVYVAGQAEKGELAEAARKTMESLRATLKFLGLKDSDVVQVKAFMRPIASVDIVRKEMAKFFGSVPMPPLVFVEWTSNLPIEIELIAWSGPARQGEPIEYLTPTGMKASPVYSRVARINHGKTIYISGLYGKQGTNSEAEIQEIFTALGGLLTQTGSDFRHLAKATYYVATDEASKKLTDLRPRYFDPARPPSASRAAVAGVGLEGKTITLDMIAVPVKK